LRLPKADADRFDRLEQERNYVTSIAQVKVKLDGRSNDGAASRAHSGPSTARVAIRRRLL
jgi:hypothetical protein